MATAEASAALEAALRDRDSVAVAERLESIGAYERFLDLSDALERAIRGSQPAIRLYVHGYRQATQELLSAVHIAQPDLVVETDAGLTLLDIRGEPAPASVALLEQGALYAPFSAWVTAFGLPRGLLLDLVNRMRTALRDTEPLLPPTGTSALAHWEVEEDLVRCFVRGVHRELASAGSPLDTIAETFELNDTELADLFDVRRQAVAQWRRDGIPSARQEKVSTIASIAEILARRLRAERVPGIARRPADAYDGLTMLEMMSSGRHAELLASVRASFEFTTTA